MNVLNDKKYVESAPLHIYTARHIFVHGTNTVEVFFVFKSAKIDK